MLTTILGLVGIGGIGAALFFIPGALPAVIGALSAAWRAILTYPLQAALIVALVACGWLWRAKERAQDDRKAALTELARVIDAGKQAEAAQLALNAATKAKGNEAAATGDKVHAIETDRNRLAGRAWGDAHRVRVCSSPPRNGDPAAEAEAAGVPEATAADADYIAVPKSDVERAIPDLRSYASACFAWGQDLLAKGLAE